MSQSNLRMRKSFNFGSAMSDEDEEEESKGTSQSPPQLEDTEVPDPTAASSA